MFGGWKNERRCCKYWEHLAPGAMRMEQVPQRIGPDALSVSVGINDHRSVSGVGRLYLQTDTIWIIQCVTWLDYPALHM